MDSIEDMRNELEIRATKREVERRRHNWLVVGTIACVASFWLGRAVERQAHEFDMACYPPTSQSESLLIWPSSDGKLLCQRRGKVKS